MVAFDGVRGSGAARGSSSSSTFTPSASSAFARSISSVRMPSNRSPRSANRPQTLSIRKSCGSNPPAITSSHVSGVETGARDSGRSEYAAAMLAPWRFMLWSMKTLPARSARQAIVTRSGSAFAIIRPHAPTRARTWPYVYAPCFTGT